MVSSKSLGRKTHTETWWGRAATENPTVLRCTAHYKDGSPSRTEAFPGTTVCEKHGALAPQVQAAAATRIQMSVDEAAQKLVDRMNDPGVDMRERVKIAHDLLDRGGLAATSRLLIGVGQVDPIEKRFLGILSDPNGLMDPNAAPRELSPETLELTRRALENDDIVDAEWVEEAPRLPSPDRAEQPKATTPKHIHEGVERLQKAGPW
jgi:hypothetical protein